MISDKIATRDAIAAMDFELLVTLFDAQQVRFKSIRKSLTLDDNFQMNFQLEMNGAGGALEDLIDMRDAYVDQLTNEIEKESLEIIAAENIHYDNWWMRYRATEHVLTYQKLNITDETREVIKARINFWMDWRYPGLEIGPGTGNWTKHLTVCEPLYLVDYNDEFLRTAASQFNEQYQARLRLYTNMGDGLHMLPQHQFGLVFSWNTFNYFSLNQIKHYLKEIKGVLRPSGACMFSYSNAERLHCAKQSENQYMTHIPKKNLLEAIQNEGFVNIRTYDRDSVVSWVEFNMPGTMSGTFNSVRAGPTLGKIIRRTSLPS